MKTKLSLLTLLFFTAGVLLGLPISAAAQDADPPGRVARLDYMQGTVSFQPSGESDWVDANLNRPLTTGDNLWADKDSRAEVHIGATAIRLASETGLSILNLDDRTAQIQLPQGTIEVHLRNLQSGNAFEIDTPNLAFTLTHAGEYVIQADPNGNSTMIIVREGEGQVTGAGESWDLAEGQQYTFTGTDDLAEDSQLASNFDAFENWCQGRDQRENNSQSARYVSRDVEGYDDLDDAGTWQNDPDYGAMWIPNGVAVGWAPYQFGHWVWIAPWGWTWVDNEPWGFAPFHYGRWAFVHGNWGWVPGPLVMRPYYAPALVGFVGGGFGFSVSFGGFDGVAWFPLGPRDVFIPGYRCSPRYVNYVNVTNSRVVNVVQVTNVYNTYRTNNVAVARNYMYANNERAVTAVSRETFVNARPVAASAVRIAPDQMRDARVGQSLAPTRTSYIASNAKPASARPRVAFSERKVVARLNPPAPANHEVAPRMQNVQPDRSEAPARTNEQPNRPANEEERRANTFNPPNRPANETERPNNQERPRTEPDYQQHPAVKYAPPTKARDENYDVHPPLNNNHEATPPKQEKQERSAPREQSKSESHPPK